ncbi:MAG: sugar transferase [Pirellulales bacterium]|nr:sugar transferase [Pirellulales bacterium]
MNNKQIQQAVKRAIDVAISAVVLLSCLPLLGCIALLIRWRMGRPILFRQQRPGLRERPFVLYKFRTMNDAHGEDGELLSDGERLTRLGRFLRRTSLDELPQLWNVLRGEMSLVGPRPLRWDYLPFFTTRERLRHTVRPGITGWAQIHGRNEASWDQRFADDVWYVENWRLGLDWRIFRKTLEQVFCGRGVVVDAPSIMKNLDEERRSMLSRKVAS